MDEVIKEMQESKIMKKELFIKAFNGGVTNYDEYKKYMSKEEFDEIVKDAEHKANIYEESWKENE